MGKLKVKNKEDKQLKKDLRLFDYIYTGLFTYPSFSSELNSIKPVQQYHASLVEKLEKSDYVYNLDNLLNFFYANSKDGTIYNHEDFINITPWFNTAWFEYRHDSVLVGFNCSVNYIDDQVYDTILGGIAMTGEEADIKFSALVGEDATKEHWASVRDKLIQFNSILSAENHFSEMEKDLLDKMSLMLISTNKDYQHPKALEFIKDMKDKELRYILNVEAIYKDDFSPTVEGPVGQWVFYINKKGAVINYTYNPSAPNSSIPREAVDDIYHRVNSMILPLLFALNMANYSYKGEEILPDSDRVKKYRKMNSIKNKEIMIDSSTMLGTLREDMYRNKISLKECLELDKEYFKREVNLNIFSKWKAIYWLSDKVKEIKMQELQKELKARATTNKQVSSVSNDIPDNVYSAIRAYNKV